VVSGCGEQSMVRRIQSKVLIKGW